MSKAEGTHSQSRRQPDGHWFNTCAPRNDGTEVDAEKRLAARIEQYEAMVRTLSVNQRAAFKKPGSLTKSFPFKRRKR